MVTCENKKCGSVQSIDDFTTSEVPLFLYFLRPLLFSVLQNFRSYVISVGLSRWGLFVNLCIMCQSQ